MKQCLAVDGCNIINAWDYLKEESRMSLETARQKLLEALAEYQSYK